MKNFSSKGIRFSGDSINSCVGFIDLVDSTKNTITMESLEYVRMYYSTFINSVSQIVKSNNGKIIKNIGDCLLFYFPKTSDFTNSVPFKDAIECCFRILDSRHFVNEELAKQHLPPFNYRISMDYGELNLALVGDYSQIDLFGSTLNVCSKINTCLSVPNNLIIGENFYKILRSFSFIMDNYHFINNGEYIISETTKYPTYTIKKKTKNVDKNSFLLDSSLETICIKSQNDLLYKNNQNNKRVIIVDDERDILFTYRSFLKDYNYNITCFDDPSLALNYVREIQNSENLVIILDIRMKNLNGLQLYQQIKAIDPTIKIIFITALDILDELLSVVPGISKEQIMRKPVDKKEFTNTVNKLLT